MIQKIGTHILTGWTDIMGAPPLVTKIIYRTHKLYRDVDNDSRARSTKGEDNASAASTQVTKLGPEHLIEHVIIRKITSKTT